MWIYELDKVLQAPGRAAVLLFNISEEASECVLLCDEGKISWYQLITALNRAKKKFYLK